MSGRNVVLHGIVHSSETLSFGGFFGQDKLESGKREFLGAEVGFEGTRFDVEAYALGNVDAGSSFSVYGVTGNHHINDAFVLTDGIESGTVSGGSSLSRYAVGVRYDVSNAVALTADIGSSRAEAYGIGGDETFVGVGAEFTFGAERGATFRKRGIFNLIPGL